MKKVHIPIFCGLILFCASVLTVQGQSNNDINLLRDINPRYPNNILFKTISSTTYPLAAAIPAGILAISLINNHPNSEKNAYEIAISLAVAAAGTEALKIIINKPRPYQTYPDIYPDQIENGNSYPSGHTSIAFALATSLALTSQKCCIAFPAYLWAVSVGYSRLYLGQHYPSDVLAGALVGTASAFATHWVNKHYFSGKKKKRLAIP